MGMHTAFVSPSTQLPFSATPPLKIIGSQVGLFLIALIISVLAAIGSPQNNPMRNAEDSFGLRPGVILDATRGELYAMNPQHGIDAIALGSGKILLTTDAAAKPLLVTNNYAINKAGGGTRPVPRPVFNTSCWVI
jgi:hypothetical protein